MSLISKIISAIQLFFKRVPKHIREYAEYALKVTRIIKQVLEHPATDIAIAIIPTDIDREIRDKLLDAIEVVNKRLDKPNVEQLITDIQQLPDDIKDAVLHKIAAIILQQLDDCKLKQSMYDAFLQIVYTNGKL